MSTDKADTFAYMLAICGADLPIPEREYVFAKPRKWRFDFAWPEQRVAVEVNGGRYAFAGGRHSGEDDLEKIRRAGALGWRVLPVTPQTLRDRPGEAIDDVRQALKWQEA
jgi:very-short-patch-repair endonuclease